MTGCSRRCASSLLALSALLLAGCGGSSPAGVEKVFAAQGIRLQEVIPYGDGARRWGLWPERLPRAMFVAASDESVVISVVVFRGEGDAAQEEELARRHARRTFERFSRVGAVLVHWDAAAPAGERAALDRALASLR